jgi:seryl-tRNA synthetase
MSKAKELQAENNNLKSQLAQVMRERDSWRNTASARQTDISSLNNTVTNYRQELWSQKAAHQRQLTQIKLDSQNAVIKAVDFCAQEAAAMLNDQARANQLEIVAAERDALGKALTYTIDNLTIQK